MQVISDYEIIPLLGVNNDSKPIVITQDACIRDDYLGEESLFARLDGGALIVSEGSIDVISYADFPLEKKNINKEIYIVELDELGGAQKTLQATLCY